MGIVQQEKPVVRGNTTRVSPRIENDGLMRLRHLAVSTRASRLNDSMACLENQSHNL